MLSRLLRRSPRRLLTVLLCGGLVALTAPPTAADTTGGGSSAASPGTQAYDDALADLRAQLDESSDAMVAAATNLHLAESALPGARRTVAATRQLLAAAQKRQAKAAHRRGAAQVQLVVATRSAETLADQVSEQHDRMGRLARAVYQGGGSLASLSMLLESRSPADFTERVVTFQSVLSSQKVALEDLRTTESSYQQQTDALEHVRDEMASADEQAQQELAVIADLEARATAAEAQVQQLLDQRDAALAAAQAAAAVDAQQGQVQALSQTSLQRELAAEAHRLLGGAGDRAGSSYPPVPGTLAWPAHGPITSPFGIRVHPITHVRKLHTGADIGIPCGTPVHAAREGTVLSAGFDPAYGYRTVVSHGIVDGALMATTYNHQSHLEVTAGQHVDVGQEIGLSGTTGYSTGCHLHLELLLNGDFVDPVPWLAR